MARGGSGSGAGSLVRRVDDSNPLVFGPDMRGGLIQARNLVGQFNPGGAGFHAMLVAAHREMAERAQSYMVEELVAAISRRGREQRESTQDGALIRAMKSPENIDYNIDRFVVVTSYLDRSAARTYWRGLEEGSKVHVGRLITGFFSDASLSTRSGPSESRNEARMIQLPRTRGVLRAVKESQREPTASRPNPYHDKGPWQFRIRNPIPAYQYMHKGAERYLASGFTERRYKQLQRELLARVVQ